MDELSLDVQQHTVVNREGPDLLISGPPGTGKTIVLLARARRLALQSGGRGVHAIVFTFNKGLAGYAREQLAPNAIEGMVDVVHFHKWARARLYDMHRTPTFFENDDERDGLVRQSIAAYRAQTGSNSTVLRRPVGWWKDEIDWIKGNLLEDWSAYAAAERIGRGKGLLPAARRVVWDVFTIYQRELANIGKSDYSDLAPRLLTLWNPVPDRFKMDHVLIDEAQDLHPAELRLLQQIARKTRTVVVDRKQKIYRATFSWKELGFDITGGRSHKLKKCYRSTRQIMALAASLRRHDPLVAPSEPDYGDGDPPDREGSLPVLYATSNPNHEDQTVLHLIAYHLAHSPTQTLAVLARSRRQLTHLTDVLRARQIRFDLLVDGAGSVTSPGVKLSTFHSAKGLEFGTVIVIGLTRGLFPPNPLQEIDPAQGEDVDEFLSTERRLLYVAMTRAKRNLYLLHGSPRTPFLDELDSALYVCQAPELDDVPPYAGARSPSAIIDLDISPDDIPF